MPPSILIPPYYILLRRLEVQISLGKQSLQMSNPQRLSSGINGAFYAIEALAIGSAIVASAASYIIGRDQV
jgi:hypothetical protein